MSSTSPLEDLREQVEAKGIQLIKNYDWNCQWLEMSALRLILMNWDESTNVWKNTGLRLGNCSGGDAIKCRSDQFSVRYEAQKVATMIGLYPGEKCPAVK